MNQLTKSEHPIIKAQGNNEVQAYNPFWTIFTSPAEPWQKKTTIQENLAHYSTNLLRI